MLVNNEESCEYIQYRPVTALDDSMHALTDVMLSIISSAVMTSRCQDHTQRSVAAAVRYL